MSWTFGERLIFHALAILGDAGFLLPGALAFVLLLWTFGCARSALGFGAAVALCVVAVTGSKIGFMACSAGSDAALRSPSGHAALSVVVYLSVAATARRAFPPWAGRLAAALCFLLVVMIAVSRVVSYAHTVAETAMGAAIGAVCLAVFLCAAPQRLVFDRRAALATLATLAMVAAVLGLFGRRVSFEDRLERVAEWIQPRIGC
jgi:membrane-associated phospholipid phosphatase